MVDKTLREALGFADTNESSGWKQLLEEFDDCVHELVSTTESAAHDLAGALEKRARVDAATEYKSKLIQLRMAIEGALEAEYDRGNMDAHGWSPR